MLTSRKSPIHLLIMPTQQQQASDRSKDRCGDCGSLVEDGKAGCIKVFEEVIAKEFGDYRYGRIHRLTVDTFCLQHPDPYMASGKSFAAHLCGVYAALQLTNVNDINTHVQKWLSKNPELESPREIPDRRGGLTIMHVYGATVPEEHVKRVKEWATSAWQPWSGYHRLASEWVQRACGKKGEIRTQIQ